MEPVAIEQPAAVGFDLVFHDHDGSLVRVLSPIGPGAEDAVHEAFALALVRWRRVLIESTPSATGVSSLPYVEPIDASSARLR